MISICVGLRFTAWGTQDCAKKDITNPGHVWLTFGVWNDRLFDRLWRSRYAVGFYVVGSEQFYRVLEAALKHKCTQLDAPKRVKTFAQAIDWMKLQGVLSETRFNQLNGARMLRNHASHADRQNLYDPTMAVTGVSLAAELINELFDNN